MRSSPRATQPGPLGEKGEENGGRCTGDQGLAKDFTSDLVGLMLFYLPEYLVILIYTFPI